MASKSVRFSEAAKAQPGDVADIRGRWARAKAAKEAERRGAAEKALREGNTEPEMWTVGDGKGVSGAEAKKAREEEARLRMVRAKEGNLRMKAAFRGEWGWNFGILAWILLLHIAGIYFFTRGFLLTRLVLEEKSSCSDPPIPIVPGFPGAGTVDAGCWHPKTFDKAVVIIIDALRYDFTVPVAEDPHAFHNALPFLYETAFAEPQNAFLLPFIADPPTTTLQRLKGLTTGTLPTFVDAGSNFAGTAIEEDNLLMQLKDLNKKIVHLGDDTWTSLFPGYFEANISRAYDSFNVWDLHTVDDGVTEHIMPLLAANRKAEWDVMFAHYLGVDHAGHRYGPDHAAMTAKLQQMDLVLREIVSKLDKDTLLVVMGDHGMDAKGDHGGESDDEVQAALWMYSKKGVFGDAVAGHLPPPQTAKERPVEQIDLVPTLALLLGLPIPFNNLGSPIRNAFMSRKEKSWDIMGQVARLTAAGVERYQAAYDVARGSAEDEVSAKRALWDKATTEFGKTMSAKTSALKWQEGYALFASYQIQTLAICRSLWARFDVPSMIQGIAILAASVVVLILYAKAISGDDAIVSDPELDAAERLLEGEGQEPAEADSEDLHSLFAKSVFIGSGIGLVIGPTTWAANLDMGSLLDSCLLKAAFGGLFGAAYAFFDARKQLSLPLPTTIWSFLTIIFTVLQCIGFASNSYTIWEDSILLFFLTTFGVVTTVHSLRNENLKERTLGIYHSSLFIFFTWASSFSKLCREEQMPFCRSTYYASSTSSTSAPWQLIIPVLIALVLPSLIKSYYVATASYAGFSPLIIGTAFRTGLSLNAAYWIIDYLDDSNYFSTLPVGALKSIRVSIAQMVFALGLVAGTTAFIYAPPCVTISTETTGAGPAAKARVTILGYANTHGTSYFLVFINVLLVSLLVTKPMGQGALSLLTVQILSLLEIIDVLSLSSSPIGPVLLAMLGNYQFFKTGHQAVLSSIQWDAAFIPLHTITYPFSPLLVALNTFAPQILTALAVPLIALWKKDPREKALVPGVVRALLFFIAYHAVVALTTSMWAGHLRRHLMLYRIFSPRFMLGGLVLGVVDVVVLFAMAAWWVARGSVGEVFGWA